MKNLHPILLIAAIILLFGHVGFAQTPSAAKEAANSDGQVIDSEGLPGNSEETPEKKPCVPSEGENGEAPVDCAEPEPVYVPVEPPPVLSDEIQFTDPASEKAKRLAQAAAEYRAVQDALGGISLEGPYKNYQLETRDANSSFSQYMYEKYHTQRKIGVAVIAAGVPIFGGLTALGIVFLKQTADDPCLSSKESSDECEVAQRRDADEKKSRGVFLLAFGTIGTVAAISFGAVKIKRARGPMQSLEPLLEKPKEKKKAALRFTGFSPVVAGMNSYAPGSQLNFSF